MKQFHRTLSGLLFTALAGISPSAFGQPSPNCADTEANHAFWSEVYASRDDERLVADALARELLPCLGSTDSDLRDTWGYGLYTFWLRNDRLSLQTRNFLLHTLTNNLQSGEVLERSFSALILSELMRADALTPFMSAAERETLLQQTLTALRLESDFRGLDAELGWVHPVAHMADVLWRFALHPALSAQQAELILAAIRRQAGTAMTSYVFNESDRLARVVAIVIRTEVLPDAVLVEWLQGFATRVNGEAWGSAFASVSGMAELHNTKTFIRALSDQLQNVAIPTAIENKLDELSAAMAGLV